MATSVIPAAIDYLVDTFRAAATLGAAAPPVQVLDGPEVGDMARLQTLWVAVNDIEDVAPTSGSSQQSWAGLGAQRKNEQLSIPCVIRTWNGDGSVRDARASAFAVLGAVEDIVRGQADLGGLVIVTLNGVDNLRLRTLVNPDGALADLAFTVDSKARI